MKRFDNKNDGLFSRDSSHQALHKHMNFQASEQYRMLRSNVGFTLPENVQCPILGITSPIRGEGKSTTAINLAYVLAENGSRVLLIDGDLRLPSIARRMGISRMPGLSDLLLGTDIPVESWVSSINPNWFIIPAGAIPPNPSELLGSSRMESVLNKLKKQFDYIIIDLPPVGAVSDAMSIAPFITGMIVVIREDYSTKKDLRQCVRQIELSHVDVLGIVVNDSGASDSKYGRRGSSTYKYYRQNPYESGSKAKKK